MDRDRYIRRLFKRDSEPYYCRACLFTFDEPIHNGNIIPYSEAENIKKTIMDKPVLVMVPLDNGVIGWVKKVEICSCVGSPSGKETKECWIEFVVSNFENYKYLQVPHSFGLSWRADSEKCMQCNTEFKLPGLECGHRPKITQGIEITNVVVYSVL
jgi:hypothetical protein